MPSALIEAIVRNLQRTVPFQGRPVKNRPINTLWDWHEQTMLQLRMPLHHTYLRKPRPKAKVYDEAIQAGLAILAAFAAETSVTQAIVRIGNDNSLEAISFQPRPFEANWNREPSLSPATLLQPATDPMMLGDETQLPRVQTSDMLHLAGKVALAIANKAMEDGDRSGHVTFQFDRHLPVSDMLAMATYRHRSDDPGSRSRHIEILLPPL